MTPGRTPAVTVHVPCYDYGRYLPDALDSLLAQTCADWEAIVTDDASTDDTAAVMARYDDPRLRFVHHERNQGHLATYNEALRLAAAPYFVILSADDRFDPRFLDRALDVLDARADVPFAFTDLEVIDETGAVVGVGALTLDPDVDWVRDVSLELVLRPFVPGGAVVARTDLLRALGGFDRALPHTCDTFLWRQLAFRGPVAHLSGRLFQHRQHDTAMHTKASWLDLMATEEAMQYERILDDPALPARVRAQRSRLDATIAVHRARHARRDGRYRDACNHFARALVLDPKVWQPDNPLTTFARGYVRRWA